MRPLQTEVQSIEDLRRDLATLCAEDSPYPAETFAGAGIVICAGGAAVFANAYVLIHILRKHLGCRLPIEVWHFGADELSDRMRFLLRALDADPVDADVVIAEKRTAVSDGWQLKSLAVIWSRFEHVLLLDADQVPETDPTPLLQWPEFAETGMVLWPDICSILPENPIWQACGLEPRRMRAVESGQMLIDKSRHWRALRIIHFLNEHAEIYYRMVYGDKDLFLLGLLLTEEPYTLVPHLPVSDQPWCLFQRDFQGNRLFQHRTGAKWRYVAPQEFVPSFTHIEACEAALSDLRRLWNGKVFNPPARSHRARAEEQRLAALPSVGLDLPGIGRIDLDLLYHGDIGRGRSARLQNWYCVGDDEIDLVLCGSGDPYRLRQTAPGRWVDAGGSTTPVVLYEGAERHETTPSAPQVFDYLRAAGYPAPLWRTRIDELRAAFGLLVAIEPLTHATLSAEAARIEHTDPADAQALRALADGLPTITAVPAIKRSKWELAGRYTFDDEHA